MAHETTLERFARTIEERALAAPDNPVLLMVSGGSDSAALAYLASELRASGDLGPLGVLHVNHKLRGDDAEEDAVFVRHLAQALDAPFFLREVDVDALVEETGGNMEAIAREERYQAAREALALLCRRAGVPTREGRIFTAHTQDDRVENFYMRSIVGTGPGGFRSMRYENGQVARPCLDLCREDLQAYLRQRAFDAREDGQCVCVLDENGEAWRTDATNAHTDRFRAYVRHTLVPAAKERNPRLLDTLCRTMNLIADEDDMLEERTQALIRDVVDWLDPLDHAKGCVVSPRFSGCPLPLKRRVLVEVLRQLMDPAARVETASVQSCIAAFADNMPVSGYTANIQGNLALSANKQGLRIEPMAAYRARRKRL